MEETGAAGGSTEWPASSGRGIVDKALVKEALGELLQEIPAFREFSARRGSTEGQRQSIPVWDDRGSLRKAYPAKSITSPAGRADLLKSSRKRGAG